MTLRGWFRAILVSKLGPRAGRERTLCPVGLHLPREWGNRAGVGVPQEC